ncbi:hypothetical protein Poli38472_010397 [Pythium oligandrum]|uniref:Uncharacterized protein n=1 Tax=Pythium oligandrum TaxID=41045 RepID=A0A8K1F9R8_PYTOL|nr:hypothetical protein Poli38472_010397 [Pythium oligandrum]|eukprot:TMW55515.1 hypothetical protein Poli38472_010397 [Pythium oligandrum]
MVIMTGLPISPSEEDITAASDPLGPWLYELRPSKPPPVVDLARTPARLLFSANAHETFVRFMRLYYGYLEHFFRFSVVVFLGLLFVNHGAIRLALLVVHPFTAVAMYTTSFFLSLDLLGLVVRAYDFWFMAVFNFFH